MSLPQMIVSLIATIPVYIVGYYTVKKTRLEIKKLELEIKEKKKDYQSQRSKK